jgi:hypothetical protein
LQLLPSLKFISWTGPEYTPDAPKAACGAGDDAPFSNDGSLLILTIGYMLIALLPFSYECLRP